ncbi:phosphoribosylanthranilate isomerase [Desulfonatronovibrio hydrogenovorans]|uniref:phosphoribosylanthranilate isomerase n=1 Tax=Desulfonatronovibrio hydrogenovorans TaxID=53245 RepID=UPI00048BA7A8|nr:phosphoribosylanthranilate isomerase [Desulfonatronovibrio hydrogenovorans]
MTGLLIKVCGLTRADDLEFCQNTGVDLTGFIFHGPSPRFMEPEQVGLMEKKNELRVGVFVDQGVDEILKTIDLARLDLVQLHGNQDINFCRAIGPDRVIRTFWPEGFTDLQDFQEELEGFSQACRYFLFDAGRSLGGHGRSISCPWLERVTSPRLYFLAGGLGPDNVGNVLELGLTGLDLNSGVESSPGIKDPEKIRQVLKLVR